MLFEFVKGVINRYKTLYPIFDNAASIIERDGGYQGTFLPGGR